jgi:anti-sigma factor RsiW
MGKMGQNDMLQRYFDDELAPDERARFEAEMTEDDRLRLAALGEMRLLLNHSLEPAADLDLWSGVSKQLDKQKAHRGWLRRRSVGGAASVLLAAVATLIFLVHPWHPTHAENDCDVESLEVDNGYATVMQIHDMPHEGDGTTTIIWAEED